MQTLENKMQDLLTEFALAIRVAKASGRATNAMIEVLKLYDEFLESEVPRGQA